MLRPALNGAALLLSLLLVALAPLQARAESEHLRTHVVYSGQRLGSIAKRYGVTVEALSRANNLGRSDAIRPGQRLVIPAASDDDSTARAVAVSERRSSPSEREVARSHRVESGQRLESIARRYGVSVEALCTANGLERASVIRPGQSLSIPSGRESGDIEGPSNGRDGFKSYLRAPKTRGKLEMASYTRHFEGRVFDKKGQMLAGARSGVARVLGTSGDRPDADKRLIRLLVQVSDRFGGRPLRIVSGYRATSFFEDSKHKSSRAVDFSIPGVPNEALRDYLRTIPNVGVGYYPNSSFVHLDVREYAAYWVDYAGPGEAPRSNTVAHRKADDVHDVEPSETREAPARAVDREPHAHVPDGGALPATGTSALAGLATDPFGSSRFERTISSPVALPKARPTLDTP